MRQRIGMAKPYALKPVLDHKRQKWRLDLPPQVSPSGRRERHLFKSHHEALAEANRIKGIFRDFGRSVRMLPAGRLIESIEAWQKLDEVLGGEAVPGSLRQIVLRECKAIQEREKSVTLAQLLEDYTQKLQRSQRSASYLKQFGNLKRHMDFWLDTKVSAITSGNIKFSLGKFPSGQFNADVRLLRATFAHGIKNSWLKGNPAKQLDFIHRAKVEVKSLDHLTVERMFRHAQAHNPELVPVYAIAFFCGLRESELWKLKYSAIRIAEKDVVVPAEITKTRRKRIIPLSENAIEWLQWYFERRAGVGEPEARLMHAFGPYKLRRIQLANFKAAAGECSQWQQNCKRRAFASHFVAAYQSLDRLVLAMGHSNSEMSFEHYVGAVSQAAGLAYFEIRP
jgi:site-specific recombinase XerC